MKHERWVVDTKSDEELRLEELFVRAWIRDVARSKQSRLRAIRKEIRRRKQENGGKSEGADLGGT